MRRILDNRSIVAVISWLGAALIAAACSVVNSPDDPTAAEDDGNAGSGASGGAGSGGGAGGTIPPGCGDGMGDPGEQCDTGGESATCNFDCTLAMCGDGKVNMAAGEECDTIQASMECDGDCTAVACGDGVYNAPAAEGCDDGNMASGDGCDSSCAVEGSCSAPLQLTFTTVGQDEVATITSRTGGAGGEPEADCDMMTSGAGSDRIYRFDLTTARRVDITLDAQFDGLVRLQSASCDPATEIAVPTETDGCGLATNGSVTLSYPTLALGAYYVVVDGQTATSEGAFTLTVTQVGGCMNGDPMQNGGCALQTVCNLPVPNAFCGGNCSNNHNQFADWWCQLGGYSGALSFNVISNGTVQCLYYNGGTNPLTMCSQVIGPASYGTASSCTAVDQLICVP